MGASGRATFCADFAGARVDVVDGDLAPAWFTTVMGTGIVALALHGLPVQVPGQQQVALGVWVLAVVLLLVLLVVAAGSWVRRPDRLRAHLDDPVRAHAFGAVPMALLTVGAGALLVAPGVLGLHLA